MWPEVWRLVRAGPSGGAAGVLVGLGQFIAWGSVPVYLLVMQRRVYGERWWLTGQVKRAVPLASSYAYAYERGQLVLK